MTVSEPSQVIQPSIPDCGQGNEQDGPVLREPPETWAICGECDGEGSTNRTIHVYEAGCAVSHPDVESVPCVECGGAGGVIAEVDPTCEVCGGDCAAANPPVLNCPLLTEHLDQEDRS
jgi:DnaJ-class molecular chaperone